MVIASAARAATPADASPDAPPPAAAPASAAAAADPAIVAHRLRPGERIALTGRLDHPAWQRAQVYRRFVQYTPDTGAAASRQTQVRVLFDDDALYVGIDARDPRPEEIRAPWVRQDQVNRTQDFVAVYIDAVGSRQSAQFFRVSASGGVADGMYTAADDTEDYAPDFDFDAAAQRSDQGYSVVLRLPFASLRYTGEDPSQWRMMVVRRVPRDQFYMDSSVLIPREAPNFLVALQPLQGVQLPTERPFLALRPSLTWHAAREPQASAGGRREQGWDATLDLKWRPLAPWVIDAALNPDFSQVALDVPQLSGNQLFALSFPEKRPFFFESTDLLRSPTDAIYTRSFTAPRWGVRSTWRGRALGGSVFAVDDRGGGLVLLPGAYGTDTAAQPGSTALVGRISGERGPLQWGTVIAARRYDGGRGGNDVAGPDVSWQLDDIWRLRAQGLASRTTALPDGLGALRRDAARSGWQSLLRLTRQNDLGDITATWSASSPGFRHDSGFVTQVGTQQGSLHLGRAWHPQGAISEFWLNLDAEDVRDRDLAQRVSRDVYPGIWMSGRHNLEWWLQWHGDAALRPSAQAEVLHQRYWKSELTVTPAAWVPFLTLGGRLGRLVDAHAQVLRDGHEIYAVLTTRPHARLEFEPRYSVLQLGRGEAGALRESAAQVLAVWHFSAAQTLRAIAQRTTLQRDAGAGAAAEADAGAQASLTWAWRRSAATVLYAGLSRSRPPGTGLGRRDEFFVKLQVDAEEARAWLGR